MSNHFHLLLQLPDPCRLSSFMAGLLRAYVHYANRRCGFVGHLWQGRFKCPAIEVDPYLLSCGRYIERNPQVARVTTEPWQYPWSSCRTYAQGEANGLLSENPWYEALAADPIQRRQRWQEFLQGEDPREAIIRQSDWMIGEKPFRQGSQQLQGRPMPRGRGRPPGPARASMVE